VQEIADYQTQNKDLQEVVKVTQEMLEKQLLSDKETTDSPNDHTTKNVVG